VREAEERDREARKDGWSARCTAFRSDQGNIHTTNMPTTPAARFAFEGFVAGPTRPTLVKSCAAQAQ